MSLNVDGNGDDLISHKRVGPRNTYSERYSGVNSARGSFGRREP